MHVPSSMLHGAICPVTAAVGLITLGAASTIALKSKEKPTMLTFGAVTALVFGAQMLNFPINHGTSGHLLGGVMAASLLGTPFAVLAVSLVLGVQALLFGDGGINTLGANFINMGLIGAGLGGSILYTIRQKSGSNIFALSIASFLSVTLAAIACSLELASSNMGRLSSILLTMIPIHALIGIGEACLTVALVSAIQSLGIRHYARTSIFFAGAAALLSPMSSPLPDGLNWASSTIRLAEFETIKYQAVLGNYQMPGFYGSALSTILAAATGIVVTFALASLLAKAINLNTVRHGERREAISEQTSRRIT